MPMSKWRFAQRMYYTYEKNFNEKNLLQVERRLRREEKPLRSDLDRNNPGIFFNFGNCLMFFFLLESISNLCLQTNLFRAVCLLISHLLWNWFSKLFYIIVHANRWMAQLAARIVAKRWNLKNKIYYIILIDHYKVGLNYLPNDLHTTFVEEEHS